MEQKAAELVAKLNSLFEGDDSLSTFKDRFKHVEESIDEFKGMDLAKAMEELDKLRTSQEQLTERIRTTRSGVYVPGLEDESKKFSLVRALTGMTKGRDDWSNVGAGREKEVLDACRTKAAQAIGDDSLGGYFVPDQVIPDVIQAIYTASVFIALDGEGTTLATVISGLTGGNVKIPKFEGGTVGFWIGEEEAYTESNATVGDITLSPKKLGVLVKLTDAMQRFGSFGFDTLLRRDITKAASLAMDNAVLFGVGGDNVPRGMMHHPDLNVYNAATKTNSKNTIAALTGLAADWTSAELDFDGLDLMQLVLEEDDIVFDSTFRTVFAPRYLRRLKQLKTANYSGQTTQMPYLLGAPMLSDARIADMIGSFSKFNQIGTTNKPGASVSAPTTSSEVKSTDVVMGNLGEIVVGRWGGIEVEDDRGINQFTTDHTLLKLRMYTDIQIRQPRALITCPNAYARD
jgi:HK97 family phage major capsid protein